MFKTLKTLWQDEDGLTTVEYAILLALISIVAIAAWTNLGNTVSGVASGTSGAMAPDQQQTLQLAQSNQQSVLTLYR